MNYKELLEKEFYIIRCKDFIYYVQPVHIVGIGGTCAESELTYYLDIKSITGRDEEMYMYQLEQYKTFEEAQKEARRYAQLKQMEKLGVIKNEQNNGIQEISLCYQVI